MASMATARVCRGRVAIGGGVAECGVCVTLCCAACGGETDATPRRPRFSRATSIDKKEGNAATSTTRFFSSFSSFSSFLLWSPLLIKILRQLVISHSFINPHLR